MWMFGSRTTVKKVRNSLTWFSQMGERTLGPKQACQQQCPREHTTVRLFAGTLDGTVSFGSNSLVLFQEEGASL